MKLKKVLAAVLAGTMVMASTAMVFAEDDIVRSIAWWSEDPAYEVGNNYQLAGDGVWTVKVAGAAYNDGENAVGADFNVELVDSETASTYYITSNTLGSIWTAGSATSDEITGDTGGTTTWVCATGDIWTITVTRSGQDFAIEYYQNGTKVIKQSVIGTNMPEDVSLHIVGAVGYCKVVCTTDGTEPEIEALTEDWYGFDDDYGASDDSAADDSSSDDASSDDTTSDDASTDDTASDDASTTDNSASDDSASTTDNSTTQTGDAAPIAAVAVALIGCAAIAFASKKRFA